MAALANAFADRIADQALDKGARRVVVLNMPDLTRTPYFRLMLAGVLRDKGLEAAVQTEAMASGWMQAFNSGLQARFLAEPRVAVVDFHAAMRLWTTPVVAGLPNLYGFTNTTEPACAPFDEDPMGLPMYFVGSCFGSSLSASRPADPDWWKTYVFSDDFHGSPMTNRLMADLVLHKLRERGWL
jgi:phospholipase/lecithinase/hemolysin